jgi:3-oxoacyl-[acyl-carrier protein] reductase
MSVALQELRILDFGSIQVGDKASLTKTITENDVEAFAAASGDYNPLHMETDFARTTSFQQRVVHGMLVASYVSTLVGMQLPGPGALWTQQSFRWSAPVFIGDTLQVTLEVTHKSEGSRTIVLKVAARNQHGNTVMEGEGSAVLLDRRKSTLDRMIADRVAVVSSGSRGVGAATARALAEAGAAVVVNYFDDAKDAEELCHTIHAGGGRGLALRADVLDLESVERMVSLAAQHFGQAVDIVVNSTDAGLVVRPFVDLSWAEIERQVQARVRGAFHCIKAALPGMLAQNSGRIVNIGSTQAWNAPPPQWTAFVVAQAALNALTRSLASELGASGIRINMVSAGLTEGDEISVIPERFRKVHAMQTPLRRLATPEDVSRAVVFLCSEGGDFITGADIPVCGGNVM